MQWMGIINAGYRSEAWEMTLLFMLVTHGMKLKTWFVAAGCVHGYLDYFDVFMWHLTCLDMTHKWAMIG